MKSAYPRELTLTSTRTVSLAPIQPETHGDSQRQCLGPYEIFSAIGAGGMGEVYRVRDTHLDRTAAIKIFPDHLADRAELRERFDCCRIGRRSWREP